MNLMNREEREGDCLRDSEVALMDAIKMILEVIVAKGITMPKALEGLLGGQCQSYPQEEMPRAIFVMESLRRFVSDPTRAEHRDQARRIRDELPAGSA